MIDPGSIEAAFLTAQRAIGGIKQAVAMGKDIKSLYVQFGAFFENNELAITGVVFEQKYQAVELQMHLEKQLVWRKLST